MSDTKPAPPYWFSAYTPEQLQAVEARGGAMAGGRYPINNADDLNNAMRAIGRTPPAGRAAVRAHIRTRAEALGLTDKLSRKYSVPTAEDMKASSESMEGAQQYEQPTSGAVHVPSPLGRVALPTFPPASVLKRIQEALYGTKRASEVATAVSFWDGSKKFCSMCDASFDEEGEKHFCADGGGIVMDDFVPFDTEDDEEDETPSDSADDNDDVVTNVKFNEFVFIPGAPKRPLVKQNVFDVCGHAPNKTATTRLFYEIPKNALSNFVEQGNRLPYIPKPGIYTHSKYGTIVITKERNKRFVENMNNHVYQSRIPLDLEHETKLSGAAAWITSLVMNEDGSVDAFAETEPMGQEMLSKNRFLFVSPEWFDEWTQPHTGHIFYDVPIGGALTTKPFYKDESLRSLVASESGITVIFSEKKQGERTMPPESTSTVPVTPTVVDPAVPSVTPQQFTEMQRQFTEQQKQFAEMELKLQAKDAEAKQFAEQLAASKAFAEKIAADTRRKAFTDEVMGRSEANNIRWFVEPEKEDGTGGIAGTVQFMEKMATAFGADSAELTHYIETNRNHAKQMSEGAAMQAQGRTGAITSDSSLGAGRLAATIKRFREADPNMTAPQAISKAFLEDPSLYEEYLKNNPAQRA